MERDQAQSASNISRRSVLKAGVATAAVATIGHYDWSQLGLYAPAAQLAAQLLTETYNQYVAK